MLNNIMFRRLNDNFKHIERAFRSETGGGRSGAANRRNGSSPFDVDRLNRAGSHGTSVTR